MGLKRLIIGKYKSFLYNWNYLKVLNSPFIGLKVKWYFSEIKHGTPYFLPRKWVKCTIADAEKAWSKMSDSSHSAIPNKDFWVKNYTKTRTKPVPIKHFGFNSCTLGWKTKFSDYRFEYSPCYSLVIFGKQLFITILPKLDDKDDNFNLSQMCYWEAWLTWQYDTDKTKSDEERFAELIKKHSCSWGNPKNGYVDYYYSILNEKYLKLYGQILENRG